MSTTTAFPEGSFEAATWPVQDAMASSHWGYKLIYNRGVTTRHVLCPCQASEKRLKQKGHRAMNDSSRCVVATGNLEQSEMPLHAPHHSCTNADEPPRMSLKLMLEVSDVTMLHVSERIWRLVFASLDGWYMIYNRYCNTFVDISAFSQVDGGKDRACRGVSSSDNKVERCKVLPTIVAWTTDTPHPCFSILLVNAVSFSVDSLR